MSERVKKSLHDGIMNLKHRRQREKEPDFLFLASKEGHRDARHAAAELAAEHEAIESALVEALEDMLADYQDACEEWDAENKEQGLEIIEKAESALSLAYGETQ